LSRFAAISGKITVLEACNVSSGKRELNLNPSDSAKTSISYRDAGVDIEAGDALVEDIKPFAKRTMRPEVLAGIGGFGSLFEVPKKFKNPAQTASVPSSSWLSN
jgi:hypothetical protein